MKEDERCSDSCSIWLRFKQTNNERGLCLITRNLRSEHTGPCWWVAHSGGDNFFRMTDDGFHSQIPLLFVSGLIWDWSFPHSSASCSDNLQTSQMSGIFPKETWSLRHERASREAPVLTVEAMRTTLTCSELVDINITDQEENVTNNLFHF